MGKGKRGRKSTVERGEILSEREKQVLQHLSQGKDYKTIATVLVISTETVRTHAHRIYTKLQVRNRKQAMFKFEKIKNQIHGSTDN